MKKIILSLLIAASVAGAVAPSADAAVVVVVGRHHRWHRHYHGYAHPRMIWVPGHHEGRWFHRHWVPGHWAPA